MPYNINDNLEAATKEFGGSSSGGTFYKIQEGNSNVVRVLTEDVTYASQFMGQGNGFRTLYGRLKGDPLRSRDDNDAKMQGRLLPPLNKDGKEGKASIRSVLYVLDRNDNKVKQAEFPYMVMKQIGALQENPDYKFTEMPMPYDIRITYTKGVAPMDMYRVEVKPNGADITEDQSLDLEDRMAKYSPATVVQSKKDRQMEEDERFGRRISEEDLQKYADEYNAGMKAQLAVQRQSQPVEPIVEYPSDDINPEDIPF